MQLLKGKLNYVPDKLAVDLVYSNLGALELQAWWWPPLQAADTA